MNTNKKPAVRSAAKTAMNPQARYAAVNGQPKGSRSGKNLKTVKPSADVAGRKVC